MSDEWVIHRNTHLYMYNRARLLLSGPPAETAHTLDNVVTEAVFHAPMSALKADASANACDPMYTYSY